MITNNQYYLIFIFFAFALFGCSHTPNYKNNFPIQKYNEYVDILSKTSYENRRKRGLIVHSVSLHFSTIKPRFRRQVTQDVRPARIQKVSAYLSEELNL